MIAHQHQRVALGVHAGVAHLAPRANGRDVRFHGVVGQIGVADVDPRAPSERVVRFLDQHLVAVDVTNLELAGGGDPVCRRAAGRIRLEVVLVGQRRDDAQTRPAGDAVGRRRHRTGLRAGAGVGGEHAVGGHGTGQPVECPHHLTVGNTTSARVEQVGAQRHGLARLDDQLSGGHPDMRDRVGGGLDRRRLAQATADRRTIGADGIQRLIRDDVDAPVGNGRRGDQFLRFLDGPQLYLGQNLAAVGARFENEEPSRDRSHVELAVGQHGRCPLDRPDI